MKYILLLIGIISINGCTSRTEVVYENVYPTLHPLDSPQVLTTTPCKFIMPEIESNIFVGFDEHNYKCYLKNQEINREQRLLYEKFIVEVNKERESWNKLNIDK